MAAIRKRPLISSMNGIFYPSSFSPECFREVMDYEHQPGDVFITTYPRSGTTWMQNIVLYVLRKGLAMDRPSDFMKLSPFVDILGLEGISKMPRPGAFKTHLPLTHLSRSGDAKYIVVLRNPKDCCLSCYNHTKGQVGFGFWDGSFDDYFECFMAGEVEYGDYFDHLDAWYPRRGERNLLWTTYEDMKADAEGVVMRVAGFLGKEYVDAIERDSGVLRNILHYTGFDYMKKNLAKTYDPGSDNWRRATDSFEGLRYKDEFTRRLNPPKDLPPHELIRKGVVGDARNFFSEEQNERLRKKFMERTAGMDVQQWYSKFF